MLANLPYLINLKFHFPLNQYNTIVAVKIPAGNYTITQTVSLPSNVLIKGAGSNQTMLTFQTGNSSNDCFQIFGNYDENNYKVIQSGAYMGSNSVSLDNTNDLNTNDFVDIRDSRSIAWEEGDPVPYSIGQIVQIQSKSGNQLELKNKLSLEHTGFETRVHKITPVKNVGIEDIHIARSLNDGAGNGVTVLFKNAVNCWVKGCELSNTSSMHIRTETSSHITVKGNFIHHAQDYGGGGRGYGVALYYRSTNCLVEDNLLNYLRHALLLSTSANSNVISYNYCWDRYATGNFLGSMNTVGDLSLHGNYAHRNLFESNNIENLFADDNYGDVRGFSNTLLTGNGPYNTFLRNYIRVEQISLHACDYATVIGSNAVVDDATWYVPGFVDYRGSVGTDHFYSIYYQTCQYQTFVPYSLWVLSDDIKNWDYFPDISYYLTDQKMKDLFSTTSWLNYNGAVYGSTYGWVDKRTNPCSISWFEPRIVPAEERKNASKKTLDGGFVASININDPINLYVKQHDNSGNTFSQASYWENDTWNTIPPNEQVTLDYQRQHFLSTQDFKPSSYEKFNFWQELPNNDFRYRNWDTISLKPNSLQVIAKFKPTANVVIKNSLENQLISTESVTDYVQFKDPWYLNVNEQPFGLRSNGLDAQPIINSSPFNLTQSSNYKGVFLNQDPTFDPNIPNYSVKVDAVQDISLNTTGVPTGRNHKFYFQKWSGTNVNFQNPNALETPVVFTQEGAVAQANLKGTQLSDNTDAYSNNSQRKFMKTTSPYYPYTASRLHSVYESMEKVWYETSTDNGYTWQIMNNGKPLSEQTSKCPSISPLSSYEGNVLITFQENNDLNDDYTIKVLIYNPDYDVIVKDLSPLSIFCGNNITNPVIQANQNTTKTHLLLVWEVRNDENPFGGFPDGLYYLVGKPKGTGYEWANNGEPQMIPNTNANSYTPCLTQKMDHYENPSIFHIVWEQRTSANASVLRYYKIQANDDYTVTFSSYNSNLSSGSGYQKNYAPSLITMNSGNVKAVWQGARLVIQEADRTEKVMKSNAFGIGIWEYKTIYKDLTTGTQKVYGTKTNLPTINKLNNTNSQFYFAYSEQSDLAGKVIIGTDLQTINDLETTGKDVQIGNGRNESDVIANVFNSENVPFYFSRSASMNHVTPKQNMLAILTGREGVVYKDTAQFYFAVGDVLLDNQPVEFIEITDTVLINTEELINTYLITEPFTLTDNSIFNYSVQYGITDSLAATQLLSENNNISFKVELLDAATGTILSSFDNVEYTQDSVYQYDNIAYQVNTSGIGNKLVRLRLVINTNGELNYSLAERIAEESVLGKRAFKQITLDRDLLVKEYALEQNYPNPFNPSTTIRYQIPKDGLVTLKIYDILGAEVATLVNEIKAAGRYEVNFSTTGGASQLASGIYFYTLKAGNFTQTRKMLLLK